MFANKCVWLCLQVIVIGQRGERFGRCGRAAGGRSQLPVRPGHVAQAAAGVAARL